MGSSVQPTESSSSFTDSPASTSQSSYTIESSSNDVPTLVSSDLLTSGLPSIGSSASEIQSSTYLTTAEFGSTVSVYTPEVPSSTYSSAPVLTSSGSVAAITPYLSSYSSEFPSSTTPDISSFVSTQPAPAVFCEPSSIISL